MKNKFKNFIKRIKFLDLIIFPIVIALIGCAIYLKPEVLIYLFVGIIFLYIYERLK